MPLSRRSTRLLIVLFVALVVTVSAWMAYEVVTEGTDPANVERREEVEREIERDAEAARDPEGTPDDAARTPGP